KAAPHADGPRHLAVDARTDRAAGAAHDGFEDALAHAVTAPAARGGTAPASRALGLRLARLHAGGEHLMCRMTVDRLCTSGGEAARRDRLGALSLGDGAEP